jgi:hypothetical protein
MVTGPARGDRFIHANHLAADADIKRLEDQDYQQYVVTFVTDYTVYYGETHRPRAVQDLAR